MNYLGIDVGSTNIKCHLSTQDNHLLFKMSKNYQTLIKEDKHYVDIESIYHALEDMVFSASNYGDIDAICISSFGESFTLLDEHDQILALPMLYTDSRGTEEAKEMLDIMPLEEIYRITGTIPQSMYSIYKFLWIKKHHQDVFKKANKFLQIADFLNYKMTDQHVTDYSLAARSGVFDIDKKTFSKVILEKLGIDEKIFPKPLSTGSVVGLVSQNFANKCKIKSSCKVIIGGHDQVMAAIGAGIIKDKMCVDGMGTVECMTTTFNKRVNDLNMGLKGYAVVPFLNGYCTYLFNYTGGSLVEWAKKELFQNTINEQAMEEKVYKENNLGPTGILSLPYFGGAATPNQNIYAKGSIINLGIQTKTSTIYKSLLEGLAYEMKYNLEVVKQFGIETNYIVASGGGTQSQLWLQIKANVFNQNIYPLTDKESGITGAIMLCSKAMGTTKELADAAKIFVKYNQPIKPDQQYVDNYQKQYLKYIKVYDAVSQFIED